MAITRPVTKTIISTTGFGIPVADALNALMLGGCQRIPVAASTIASGATGILLDRTYTVGPNVKGLLAMAVIGTTLAGAADLLFRVSPTGSIMGNSAVPGLSGASVTCMGLFTASAGSVRVVCSIYAWSAGTVTVDGTKSQIMIMPVANIIPDAATAFP